jgi:PhnB protein
MNAPAYQKTPLAAAGAVPYLAMRGHAAAAAEFYGRAFGAELVASLPLPDGQSGLWHAEIAINGGKLCITDHMGPDGPASMNFGHLQLEVADGRAWWDRAVAAGCKVVMPYERQFWGDDWGLLEDPFGIRWAVLQSNPQH